MLQVAFNEPNVSITEECKDILTDAYIITDEIFIFPKEDFFQHKASILENKMQQHIIFKIEC